MFDPRTGQDYRDLTMTDSHPELPLRPDDPPLHLRPSALAWVFVGGIVGTGLRVWLEDLFPTPAAGWPWATFAINLGGAFVLGVLLETLRNLGPDSGTRQRIRLFAGTGLCGAFTTYSTFALEVSLLGREHAIGTAIVYAITSVIAGVLLAWLGIALAARFVGGRTRS